MNVDEMRKIARKNRLTIGEVWVNYGEPSAEQAAMPEIDGCVVSALHEAYDAGYKAGRDALQKETKG